VCGERGLPVAFNPWRSLQSLRRAVGFGWQRFGRLRLELVDWRSGFGHHVKAAKEHALAIEGHFYVLQAFVFSRFFLAGTAGAG
jgi:hypothetical protein